jgi:2,5-diamino-6-(ribosylamino)-4(3H)-pyrimidinone 5'-phosphate reductase
MPTMGAPTDADASRPLVWVNCAVSADGRLAFAGGKRARLSSPEDLVRVQRMRAASDAILVGVGTVIADDPSLTVHWELLHEPPGRDPVRVIVDASGRTPPNARVLDGSIPTIVATSQASAQSYPAAVDVIVAGPDRVELAALFRSLADRGIRRLMVEGGASILASVLRHGLFDRLTVYYAPVLIGGTSAPPMVSGPEVASEAESIRLKLVGTERMGEGLVVAYEPVR